jgi:hypothetical protein
MEPEQPYQKIALALLRSPEWQAWYQHARGENLFDVDETSECGWMSDKHFKAFMEFVRDEENSLEHQILTAYPNIRQIVFHSDGTVTAKTGANAPKPKKLYTVRPKKNELPHVGKMATIVIKKSIEDNKV